MKRILSILLAALMAVSVLPTVLVANAAEKKRGASLVTPENEIIDVVNLLEIMVGDQYGSMNLDGTLTRAQFVKMVVQASTYRAAVNKSTEYSPYPDVRGSHWAAPYVKAAADSGLVKGYLDGTFRPDNPVSLEEAATIVLRLLGYTADDLSGSYPIPQLAKYADEGLDAGVIAVKGEAVTRRDCMHLIYNMLCTKNKDGAYYCTTLGCAASSDGIIDRMVLVESESDGNFVYLGDAFDSRITFDPQSARVYRDDEASSFSEIEKYDYISFNNATRTLWCCSDKVFGTVGAISSSNASATVNNISYTAANSTVAGKFSAFGDIKTDDLVMLVLTNKGEIADAYPATSELIALYSDDDTDLVDIVNSSIEGGKAVKSLETWKNDIPFDMTDAVIIYDNTAIDVSDVRLNDVFYYSKPFKTVYIYRKTATGLLDSVVTASAPQSVTVGSKTYNLGNNDVKYKFSVYGDFKKDDFVTLLLGRNDVAEDAVAGDISTVLDDDDIDLATTINSTVKGPIISDGTQSWQDEIPMSVENAVITYESDNNVPITSATVKRDDIIYYSVPFNTIYVYRKTVTGAVNGITYSGSTPAAVTVGTKNYTLGTNEIKVSFYNGVYKKDDFVTLLLGRNDEAVSVMGGNIDSLMYDDDDTDFVGIIEATVKGPIIVGTDDSWRSSIPLDLSTVTVATTSDVAEKITVATIKQNDVLYYSVPFKTLYVYRDTATGVISSVVSAAGMPNSIIMSGKTYSLGINAIKVKFYNGVYKKDDFVTLLLGRDGAAIDVKDADAADYSKYTTDSATYSEILNATISDPIVVLDTSSWKSSIPFDTASAMFYRENAAIESSDIKLYDVIYYSAPLKSVWVYDERVTGTFEGCTPSRISPTSVVIAGNTYSLETADAAFEFSSMGSYKFGDIVTVLVGRSGIAAVLDGSVEAQVNYGVISAIAEKEYTRSNGTVYTADTLTVTLPNGKTVSYEHSDYGFETGDFVKVSVNDGEVSITDATSKTTSSTAATVNSLISSRAFSDNVSILDVYSSTVLKIYPSRLYGATLTAKEILYYSLDENGKIETLMLNDVTGDMHNYMYLTERDSGTSSKISYTGYLGGKETTVSASNFVSVKANNGVALKYDGTSVKRIEQIYGATVRQKELTKTTCLIDDTEYEIWSNASFYVYDSDKRKYVEATIDDIIDGDFGTIRAYYDDMPENCGRVRIIMAR